MAVVDGLFFPPPPGASIFHRGNWQFPSIVFFFFFLGGGWKKQHGRVVCVFLGGWTQNWVKMICFFFLELHNHFISAIMKEF